MKNKSNGFTLLELMIVVVIIAILATFAIFNYSRYAYRARRADGKEMMTRVAAAEERYYTNRNFYTSDVTQLGFTGDPTCSERCYYKIGAAFVGGDNQTYVLTATPQSPAQNNDMCGALTLNNAGAKTPLANAQPQNSNGPCW